MTLAMPEGYTVHTEALRTSPMLVRKPMRTWLWSKGLLPSSMINDALKVRALLRQQLLDTFQGFDLLLSPTTTTPAALYDDYVRRRPIHEDMEGNLSGWISYCGAYAIAAMPAISVPCGFTSAERPLPVGMQLGGPPFAEERLLQVAHAYQQATEWHTRRAPAALA